MGCSSLFPNLHHRVKQNTGLKGRNHWKTTALWIVLKPLATVSVIPPSPPGPQPPSPLAHLAPGEALRLAFHLIRCMYLACAMVTSHTERDFHRSSVRLLTPQGKTLSPLPQCILSAVLTSSKTTNHSMLLIRHLLVSKSECKSFSYALQGYERQLTPFLQGQKVKLNQCLPLLFSLGKGDGSREEKKNTVF